MFKIELQRWKTQMGFLSSWVVSSLEVLMHCSSSSDLILGILSRAVEMGKVGKRERKKRRKYEFREVKNRKILVKRGEV